MLVVFRQLLMKIVAELATKADLIVKVFCFAFYIFVLKSLVLL